MLVCKLVSNNFFSGSLSRRQFSELRDLIQDLKHFRFLSVCKKNIAFSDLLKSDDFPEDAKQRANEILQGCKGRSVGE